MIRALFNRPFTTREEIDYIRAAIATPKILLHCELRPARATRISGPNSIGMSTGLGKLRARIKRLGYGQWGATSDGSDRMRAELSHVLLNLAFARSSPRVDLAFVATPNRRPLSSVACLVYGPPIWRPSRRLSRGRKIRLIACCVSTFQGNANGANLGDALRRTGTRQQLSSSPRFAQTRVKNFRRKTLLS